MTTDSELPPASAFTEEQLGALVQITTGMGVNYIAGSSREDEMDSNYTLREWLGMDEEQRSEELDSAARDMVSNHLDSWAAAAIPEPAGGNADA
jgi:hypothetical protein